MPYRIQRALKIFKILGEKPGNVKKGEWRMVVNPAEILRLEKQLKRKNKNYAKSEFISGLIEENRFYIFLKMFFERPVGNTGKTDFVLYSRVLWAGQLNGNSGVAVLAATEDNKIALSRTWRPSVMNWVLETPGTIKKAGEKIKDALWRCVKDEIGLKIKSYELLSKFYVPERGIMGGVVPVYFVRLKSGIPSPTDPAIRENIFFSKNELEKIIKKGEFIYKGVKHFSCEGYLISALYLAEKKGLI
ncbi:NUDIX domain-containing protein [Candidatus Falkowbacteria bacterium]|nr:NUDIX domain-containing protein [Candidatus Falkowbacteria bacterium]